MGFSGNIKVEGGGALDSTILLNTDFRVYRDERQGEKDKNDESGWYFINDESGKKINWRFYEPDASVSQTVDDIENIFMMAKFYSNDTMPFIQVYTRPQGVGDASPFYRSRFTYTAASPGGITRDILLWVFDKPDAHTDKEDLELTFSAGPSAGPLDPSEEILYVIIGTGSTDPLNEVEFTCKTSGIKVDIQHLYSYDVDRETKRDTKIYVDPAFGNDNTAEVGKESKPFATIQAAVDAYSDGDSIEINGTITLEDTVTFGNNGTNYILEFKEGCTLEADFDSVKPMFTTIGAQNYQIHGRGSFNNGYLLSPGNNAPRVFSAGTGGTFEIFGAKTISCFGGVTMSANAWLNIRNVDEIFSLSSISFITGFRSDRDGVRYGFIENCNFKRPDNLGVTYLQALGSGQKIIFNDCNFIGGGGAGAAVVCTNNNGNLSTFELNRCNVQSSGAARGVWLTTGEATYTFNGCNITTENQVGMLIGTIGNVNIRDCKIIAQSLCVQYAIDAVTISFYGTNTMITTASAWVVGIASNKVRNTGVILSNKRPGFLGSQIWRVGGFNNAPVPGDQYSVTANDGTVASYTVVGGNTQNDVINGLRDACIAKGQETDNDMTDWVFTTVGGVGSQELQIVASSPDYNYDLDEGETWAASTTGADVMVVGLIGGTAGFTMVGGQFLIDDTITL